jgi:predicted DNA-binding transcriptional regulator
LSEKEKEKIEELRKQILKEIEEIEKKIKELREARK